MQVKLNRPFVSILARINTALLMQGKSASISSRPYAERSLIGTAGEVALHLYLTECGGDAQLFSMSDIPQAVDHLLNGKITIQSKTLLAKDHTSFVTVPPDYKLALDRDAHKVDCYSWAAVYPEIFRSPPYINVDLFAFAPSSLIGGSTMDKVGGRRENLRRNRRGFESYVYLGDIPVECSPIIFDALGQTLPITVPFPAGVQEKLTSSSLDDQILEALIALKSPRDADRVITMLCENPPLMRTIQALFDGERRNLSAQLDDTEVALPSGGASAGSIGVREVQLPLQKVGWLNS